MIRFIHCLLLLIPLGSSAQITFEKGYYINTSNQRVEGLIKHTDKKSNPTKIFFKEKFGSKEQIIELDELVEFGLGNFAKYEKHLVKIDKSNDFIAQLSTEKALNFIEETLLLKVIVESETTSLYSYNHGNIEKFFFRKLNEIVTQLAHKKYKDDSRRIRENNRFRQQLSNQFKCTDTGKQEIDNLNYRTGDLKKFFIGYFDCTNTLYHLYERQGRKLETQINLTASGIYATYDMSLDEDQFQSSTLGNIDFGHAIGMRIGTEFEFILPYFKKTWSVTISPRYTTYKNQKEVLINPLNPADVTTIARINYNSIDLPLGIRHRKYTPNGNLLLISLEVNMGISSGSQVSYDILSGPILEIEGRPNIILGLAYSIRNRWRVHISYDTPKELLKNYFFRSSRFGGFSLGLGYKLSN